jgi:hypothetical protein
MKEKNPSKNSVGAATFDGGGGDLCCTSRTSRREWNRVIQICVLRWEGTWAMGKVRGETRWVPIMQSSMTTSDLVDFIFLFKFV